MEALKSWMISITVSSLIIAVLKIILPNNNNGRAAKILISVVFISIVITPLIENKMSFDINDIYDKDILLSNENDTNEMIENQLMETAKSGIKDDIIDLMKSNNETPESIDITMSKNANNEITVSEIFIIADNLKYPDKIGDLIKLKYNCEVKIVSSEE